MARRFHNDAVGAARRLREHRKVRWFRLAGHAPFPLAFEMDDESPAALVRQGGVAAPARARTRKGSTSYPLALAVACSLHVSSELHKPPSLQRGTRVQHALREPDPRDRHRPREARHGRAAQGAA